MSTKKELKIKYQKAYDFKTSFVSGIHGGVGTNGLLTASLFTDRSAMPDSTLVTLGENNAIVTMDDIRDSDMIREAQVAIIMDINTTKLIVGWLNGKIQEMENLIKSTNG